MKLLTAFTIFFIQAACQKLPVGLDVRTKDQTTNSIEKVVFEGRFNNLVTSHPEKLEDRNLYVVELSTFEDFHSELADVSQVFFYQEMDFAVVEPKDGKLKDLAEMVHAKNQACGTLVALDGNSAFFDPLTVAKSPLSDVGDARSEVKELIDQVDPLNIKVTISALEKMGTRFHSSPSGIAVSDYLAKKYQKLIPESRDDVTISLSKLSRSPQANVVVRIEGTDASEEVVILGSHIDSIAQRNQKRAPGADDDASGTDINLEIFRLLMANNIKPKRSIEIHGYAAEEVGLLGSSALAASYQRKKIDVISMVQFDLALYTRGGSLDYMYFVSNGTSEDLTSSLTQLVKSYLPAQPVLAKLTAGTSDYRSWARKGYHAAMPTENPKDFNRKIHTQNDRLENLDKNAIQYAGLNAKLGLAYLMHYAVK